MEKWLLKCQRSTQGVDGIFWVYFRYHSPPVCCSCWWPLSALLLLQLPGSLLHRKGGRSPPRSSQRGQRQLEPKHGGFHRPRWMLPGPKAQAEPRWALGGAWPHHQPCSPAPVSMARSLELPYPLLWALDKGPWGGAQRVLQGVFQVLVKYRFCSSCFIQHFYVSTGWGTLAVELSHTQQFFSDE